MPSKLIFCDAETFQVQDIYCIRLKNTQMDAFLEDKDASSLALSTAWEPTLSAFWSLASLGCLSLLSHEELLSLYLFTGITTQSLWKVYS